MPDRVTCKIVETEPVVKGQTAANSFNPAILDNGVRVMIPPFVGEGEAIIVSTETMEYVERASPRPLSIHGAGGAASAG